MKVIAWCHVRNRTADRPRRPGEGQSVAMWMNPTAIGAENGQSLSDRGASPHRRTESFQFAARPRELDSG